MSDESYKEYLAARVISENRPVCFRLQHWASDAHSSQVTYRLLSRALKVHVNVAKQYVHPRKPQDGLNNPR